MAKEIILHHISDWSKINEKEGFWGRIDLLKPDVNFGIHRYENDLWTSGQVGVGRLYESRNLPLRENSKEHILIVSSSYGLDPWFMLESVMLDDEYESYLVELEDSNRELFRIGYDQPLIQLPYKENPNADLLFALSFIYSCYNLCRKGIKKTIIHHEENFTAKIRGRIDVSRNIKNNTARGRNDRFFCKYVGFTEDNDENRILKAALLKSIKILNKRIKEKTNISEVISFCINSLKHVKTISINYFDYKNISYGGLYSYYKPVILHARAILSLDSKRSKIGSRADQRYVYVIPYSINMETLFEYYARTELKKSLGESEYRVGKYSDKVFVQQGVQEVEQSEKGIHLSSYCIPDIVVLDNEKPIAVLDAKYKISGRPDRYDSHQLLAYVLLTGVNRCGFILPSIETKVKEMHSSRDIYLPLAPSSLRYYELLLGNDNNLSEIKKILS